VPVDGVLDEQGRGRHQQGQQDDEEHEQEKPPRYGRIKPNNRLRMARSKILPLFLLTA
jgi:hypothetical protein